MLSSVNDKKPTQKIRRESYEQWIGGFMDKPIIKVLTGIRRSGKSTIMRLIADGLIERGVAPQRVVFLNMESLENARYCDIALLHELVKKTRAECAARLYLFLDEVQEIPAWEKAVNSFLADDLADIVISGSNSNLLSGELASHLSGRYVEFPIFPLVFSEFLRFRRSGPAADSDAFKEFLQVGGFPGLHSFEFNQDTLYQYLSALADSLVLKDVVMRHRVRDVALLEKLLGYVADSIGNIVSARSIADFFKNERRSLGIETIYNYLSFLESAFIIHRVPRFDIKGKRLLETHEKYFLADIGLRHALLGYRDGNINQYLENIVFLELRKRGYSVFVGKLGEMEVDFVAVKGQERIYLQVAYLLADQSTREREFRPLQDINDNHQKYESSHSE